MKNIFKTKLNTASLVLIPACIGINYLGKLFASVLKLPLWLDSPVAGFHRNLYRWRTRRTDHWCDLWSSQQPNLWFYNR